jgi:hypothetical protein
MRITNKKSMKFLMFDVSPEGANLWFDISNAVLFLGAVLVALGTFGTIKFSSIKEKFSDERISANEVETKRSIAESDKANAELEKAKAAIEVAKTEAALANERAAELKKEALELQIKLLPLTTQRRLNNQQIADLVSVLSKFPTVRVNVIPGWTTKEVTDFAKHLAGIINFALVSGGAPAKYEGDLTPVLLQSANGWLGTVLDGITVQHSGESIEAKGFSDDLVSILTSAGISAKILEKPQRSGTVAIFVGAVPPT